jgi:sugar/nucleoside kinase (ribokinase family)
MSHIVGIGHSIYDVMVKVKSDELHSILDKHDAKYKVMNLVDLRVWDEIASHFSEHTGSAGGSVANTMATLGMLGMRPNFITAIGDDEPGHAMYEDMKTCKVNLLGEKKDINSGRSLIAIDETGERTMFTCLGEAGEINYREDLDESIAKSCLLFAEGYLFDSPAAKACLDKVVDRALNFSTRIALSLSDPTCVERNKSQMLKLCKSADIVIGNEDEFLKLMDVGATDSLIDALKDGSGVKVVTRGDRSVIVMREGYGSIVPVDTIKPVDTTGAGDQFAAGFLYGYLNGKSLKKAVRIGNRFAGAAIQHVSARLVGDVRSLL